MVVCSERRCICFVFLGAFVLVGRSFWPSSRSMVENRHLHYVQKTDDPLLRGLIDENDDDPVSKLLNEDDALLEEEDDEAESLLLDDIDDPGLDLEEDDEEEEEEEEDEDDEISPDSLAELLQMGQLGTPGESLQEEWERRERERATKKEREANTLAKRKQKDQQLRAFEESRGIGFLRDDPVCRAVIACVTTGSAEDNATVALLNNTLYDRFGDTVVLTHNPDPEPEPDEFPFFEVWLEGYRQLVLHARNWHDDGDLSTEKIHQICNQVEMEISEDAAHILGTYT